jgi:uncharacterized membrane protein YjjP (DUF1212 family)
LIPEIWLTAWVFFFSSPPLKGDHSMTTYTGTVIAASILCILSGFALIGQWSKGFWLAAFVLWMGGTILLKMEGVIR